MYSWTRPREGIFDYQPWLLGPEMTPVEVTAGQRHGKSLIASLPGVDSPEQARTLMRQTIAVRRDQLPPAEEGSYYWADLIGLDVVTTGGEALGAIARMMETGAHDVMVVRGGPDGRERLIPFVIDRFVKRVDLAGNRLEVDWDADWDADWDPGG